MHNQDTAKDDVMEAMFVLLKKLGELYRKDTKTEQELHKDDKEEEKNDVSDTSEKKVLKFQKAMKNILESDADQKVKEIAKTFYDHPKDSMKMLQSIISEQARNDARELVKETNESLKLIKKLKSEINMSDSRALDHIAFINILEDKEQKKSDYALSVLSEMNPLEKNETKEKASINFTRESEIDKQKDLGLMKNSFEEQSKTARSNQQNKLETEGKSIQHIDIKQAEKLLQGYYKKLEPEVKEQYKFSQFDFNPYSKKYSLKYEKISDPQYSGKTIELNMNDGKVREIDNTVVDEHGAYVSKKNVINEFDVSSLQKEIDNKEQEKANDEIEPER
ncbi:hypothetical protein G3M81_23060 [Bacillus paralicheniformis]|uniref:hypothetical protein n=1 Tax=Bacillus TaxID=1386 RepID=UPI0013EEB595|nr:MULTISPECIES: hypothetical protein [Bacillus]QII26972.1 hypothetical protein G3M80_20970 [Bacillus altitudinis]QII51440.1 hypothetical protein G3M81_23060 [Bacillus paralicheniformis]